MKPQAEHEKATFLSYIKKKIFELDDKQRFVILMVDEIHLKPFFDYKGGSITGAASNSTETTKTLWFLWFKASHASSRKYLTLFLCIERTQSFCTSC
ncbi:hypothetical protein HPB47_019081 [Ixodes persulcatus]|uniref:Uncharacterized protein n=1 Tax=Ixodes persulcatus TaxID=34615 RepID=A0AC60QJ59_IXOPE|nr:hypothetical protein HPB47_019081 [Ixodes persulcatus]